LEDSGDIIRVLKIKGLAVNSMPEFWLVSLKEVKRTNCVYVGRDSAEARIALT
jgi:hypothetical protein